MNTIEKPFRTKNIPVGLCWMLTGLLAAPAAARMAEHARLTGERTLVSQRAAALADGEAALAG